MKYYHPNKYIIYRHTLHATAFEHVDQMQGFNFARYEHTYRMEAFSFVLYKIQGYNSVQESQIKKKMHGKKFGYKMQEYSFVRCNV
jgi:hypothetical protein